MLRELANEELYFVSGGDGVGDEPDDGLNSGGNGGDSSSQSYVCVGVTAAAATVSVCVDSNANAYVEVGVGTTPGVSVQSGVTNNAQGLLTGPSACVGDGLTYCTTPDGSSKSVGYGTPGASVTWGFPLAP